MSFKGLGVKMFCNALANIDSFAHLTQKFEVISFQKTHTHKPAYKRAHHSKSKYFEGHNCELITEMNGRKSKSLVDTPLHSNLHCFVGPLCCNLCSHHSLITF